MSYVKDKDRWEVRSQYGKYCIFHIDCVCNSMSRFTSAWSPIRFERGIRRFDACYHCDKKIPDGILAMALLMNL